MRRAVLALIAFIPSAFAQLIDTKEALPKFDIADVHTMAFTTNANIAGLSGGLMRGGIYALRRATMLDLITTAYSLDPQKVFGGPSWLEMDQFEVIAKTSPDTKPETAKLMLRSLLADRFHLVIHNDTKPVPAWALTAPKKPSFKQSDGTGEAGCKADRQNNGSGGGGDGRGGPPSLPTIVVNCHNETMASFVKDVSNLPASGQFIGSALVVDQTGLEGGWDFTFKYTIRAQVTTAGAEIVTLFDALEKQLGMKLDATKSPIPVVFIESVEQKPTPNLPEVATAFEPMPTEFEVADIKPTGPDVQNPRFQIQAGGRVNMEGLPIKQLIEAIWGLTDDMVINAPKYSEDDRWTIVAKAPAAASMAGVPGQNDLPVDVDALLNMLKTLLAERFKFAFHMEERTLSAFTLTANKPKLKKADPTSRTGCKEGAPNMSKTDARDSNPVRGRLLSCQNMTMAQLAQQLQIQANGYVHSAVLDSTGLEGGWDFSVNFSTIGQLRGGNQPPVPGTNTQVDDPNGALSLPDALDKQLGLKLESQKRPVQVMVIDHLEQKPVEN